MNPYFENRPENRPGTESGFEFHCEPEGFGEPEDMPIARRSFRPMVLFFLTWTVAVPGLMLALLVAVQALFLLAANERFNAAARFGAREAANPSATRASILGAVDRGFSSERMRSSLCAVEVYRQRSEPGEAVSVALLYNPSVAVPDLVGWLGVRLDHRALVIRNEAPGR